MAAIDDAVQTVVIAAGWKTPEPDASGAYHFHLQGGLDFALFSLDGRSCIMRGEVCELPAEGPARDDLLRNLARRQIGACRRRPSTLALEQPGTSLIAGIPRHDHGCMTLFRQIPLSNGNLTDELRGFLNDLAWWRASLDNTTASPSSFGLTGGMTSGTGFMPGFGMGGLR